MSQRPNQKKMTAKDLQRQAEREAEMKAKQAAAAVAVKETIKVAKQQVPVPAKKAVQSAADLKRKAQEEKRRKEEEARRIKEEQERLQREEEERLLREQEELEAMEGRKDSKKALKQQRKREQAGVQALLDDNMDEGEKNAAIDELLFLLNAEQQEKRQREKEQRDKERMEKEALEAAANKGKKKEVKQEKENSWDMGEGDDDLDIFGDDGDVVKKDDKKKEDAKKEEKKAKKEAKTALQDGVDMRSPIVCVLGHVDTGKTSILDHIRQSTVQQREEGGITQQIGASFLSTQFVKEKTASFPHKLKFDVPGLLIVDTPGHESFSNLRTRGQSLADITILVVDIMHGIEPQTIESINILKARQAPFVIALNKIDRLYNWKPVKDRDSKSSIEAQGDGAMHDFETKYQTVKNQMGEQGFFVDFWWSVQDITQVVPIVPTSAVTGEGLCDLLAILVQFSQQMMKERLLYTEETQCTVLEVRKTEGFGFTLDCILVNGKLRRGQKIVIAGQEGPIVSTIRNLLTPQEAKEIREASAANYARNEELQAAVGCKIAGEGLELAVAGSTVYVCDDPDDEEEEEILKEAVMDELKQNVVKANSEFGVAVHGNSLGAIEALVGYLRSENTARQREPVNVSLVQIGPVTKQTVQEIALQAEKGHPEYAVVLAFDVAIDKEIQDRAKELKVTIITAKIIYHLYDEYQIFLANWHKAERERLKDDMVVPCVFKPILIIHNRNPVIIGVRIKSGVLQLHQRVALPTGKTGGRFLGHVASIEANKVAQKEAKPGEEVSIRIDTPENYIVGKDGIFDADGKVSLCTQVSRKAIDVMKLHYREELKEWGATVKEIKALLEIK